MDSALRVTYVKALSFDQPHMVLAWYETPDADPLVLDNIEPHILPASQRPDLNPAHSFNGSISKLAQSPSAGPIGDAATLSHWRQLRERPARAAHRVVRGRYDGGCGPLARPWKASQHRRPDKPQAHPASSASAATPT
ncbi:MAG: hypothetical protein IPH23_02555 [Gammaproteobacteria bacterium]|nr:hypothetical protein [Gammaproteobacteria bacterium]